MAGGARPQPGGDDFLHVRADVRRAELRHRALARDAREEVRRPVALVGRQWWWLDDAAAVGRRDLQTSRTGTVTFARRPRLVDDQGPPLAVHDHRERRLTADL